MFLVTAYPTTNFVDSNVGIDWIDVVKPSLNFGGLYVG